MEETCSSATMENSGRGCNNLQSHHDF